MDRAERTFRRPDGLQRAIRGFLWRFPLCLVVITWVVATSLASGPEEEPPSLALRDLTGAQRSLEELRGRIVVLNFWATWCLPCREEMPILLDIRERYGARGVDVIAASTDERNDMDAVLEFVRREKITFPVWMGATSRHMRDLGLGDGLPATAIIDAHGMIVFRIKGMVTPGLLEERLEFLLGGGSAPAPASVVDHFQDQARHDHGEEHGHEEEHDHGTVAEGDASLVPS